MKHTKEEILNALKIIKDECSGTHCKDCPFGNEGGDCNIPKGPPEDWVVKKEGPEQTWRAFK